MQIKKTRFKGLKIITNKIYKDSRGYFKEDFKQALFKGSKFIFSCTSRSKKNVLRGLHMQTKKKQGKFVSVLKGSILDVVVDLRKNSKTFGKHFKIELTEKNGKSIFIPPGFAHGFCVLSDSADLHYKASGKYDPDDEGGLNWRDPQIGIAWPDSDFHLKERDKNFPFLEEIDFG